MQTAMGDVNVTVGSAVGRLGEDAAAAEAAAAAAAVSRDAVDPAKVAADKVAADAVIADKAAADKVIADKTAADKVAADAITVAEKAVTDAKTPEEKTAAEAKLAELKGGKPAEKKTGAPEKYEAFKLPDGVKLDEAALAEAAPLFKDLDLTQEQAQKLIDFQAKNVATAAKTAVDNWNSHMDTTLAAAKADKDVGGHNWDQSIGHAAAFIKAFGTPALQAYLNTAEAGSHVEIIRAFAKAGKAVSQDGFVPGAASPSAPVSLADRIFPVQK